MMLRGMWNVSDTYNTILLSKEKENDAILELRVFVSKRNNLRLIDVRWGKLDEMLYNHKVGLINDKGF